MIVKNKLHSNKKQQRELRRVINRAMAGAVLGAGLLTVPAMATNYVVNTTSDSPATGQTSLRQAIAAANLDGNSDTITFDPAIGANPTFTVSSALPSVTNPSNVDFDTSNVGNITLQDSQGNPAALSAASNGQALIIAGAATSGGNGTGVAGSDGLSNSITANTVTNDNSTFTVTAGIGGNGGTDGAGPTNGGIGGNGGNNSLTGNVTTNNSSSFTLNSGFGGNGGSTYNGGNGGGAGVGGNNTVTADTVTANDSSTITLQAGGGQTSSGANAGTGGAGGDNSITANSVTANGNSQVVLNAGGGGFASFGGVGGAGGNNNITSDNVTANDSSSFMLQAGSNGSTLFGGTAGVGGNNTIDGNITANSSSLFTLIDGASQPFGVGAGGQNIVTGNANFNDQSVLRNQGNNALNTVGNTTTTFGQNATFAPYIDFANPDTPALTVNNLTLNNSLLQPYLTQAAFTDPPITFNTGTTFDVLNYTGTLSGVFDTPVVSPLTFDVNYTSPTNGQVQLTLTGIDFNNVRGNQNQRSLENYLNNFVITGDGTVSLNQDSLPFNLASLTEALTQNGPNALNNLIPDNYSAHSEQTYLNQKYFMDLVAANMRNDRNMVAGSSSFALNQSFGAAGANGQLSSLRGAMDAPVNRLGFTEDSSPLTSGGVWAAYQGARVDTDGDSGIGSRGWDSSTDGYALGYTAGGGSFTWGIAGGHEQTNLNFDGGTRGEVDGYNGALYAAWTHKSSYLNAILGYGKFQNDAYSNDSDTNFNTHAVTGSLELGKRLSPGKSGGLTPYASLLYSHITNDDINDQNAGLTLKSGSNNVTTGTLGIRYNHRMYDQSGSLKGGWQAGLAYLHQFGDTDFAVQGSYSTTVPGTFSVQTTPLDTNAAQVQLGAYGRIHGSLIGFVGYQGTFGSNQKINAVNAGIGYKF